MMRKRKYAVAPGEGKLELYTRIFLLSLEVAERDDSSMRFFHPLTT